MKNSYQSLETEPLTGGRKSGWSIKTLIFAAIGLQLVVACFLCVTMLQNQALTQQLQQMQAATVSAANIAVDLGEKTPHKVAIPYITPRANQANRGTCWDFATIGLLEWSYRANGIKNGWLKPDEYVKFSEQAYGVTVLDRCQKFPKYCVVPNDAVWLNSTDGGEIPFLYSLPEMDNAIVPEQVCVYQPNEGHDTECPNLDKALRDNPIKFQIKSMTTLYEIDSIKAHLRKFGRALGFSTVMTSVLYYYPCTGSWANTFPECQPLPSGGCHTYCPITKFPAGTCCRALKQPNYNREAEFVSRGDTDFEDGGHAMLLVGYNDDWVTTDGNQGGFILKNNWYTNATHTIDYFMGDISRWDENYICPNSNNPRNWYTCETIERCLSERTIIYANVSRQPLELKCVDAQKCNVGDNYAYFIKNYTHVGDDMHILCLFEWNSFTRQGLERCEEPLVLDTITTYLKPRNPASNDPDRCGFYFFPYKLVKAWWYRWYNSYATDFEIEWDPQSYVANKDHYPHLDYSWLERSTKLQNSYDFAGPIPYEYMQEPDQEDIALVREEYQQSVQRMLAKKNVSNVPAEKPQPKPPKLHHRRHP